MQLLIKELEFHSPNKPKPECVLIVGIPDNIPDNQFDERLKSFIEKYYKAKVEGYVGYDPNSQIIKSCGGNPQETITFVEG